MKDLYSKRLNVLIRGLKEAPAKPGEENLGESRADTLIIFRRFLSEGLQIVEPSSISLVDIYRFPQRQSQVEFGKIKAIPMIVKLATQDDKNRIYQLLQFLKFYNLQNVNPYTGKRNPNVYVIDHFLENLRNSVHYFFLYSKPQEKIRKLLGELKTAGTISTFRHKKQNSRGKLTNSALTSN